MSERVICHRLPCVILSDGSPCAECRPADPVSSPLLSSTEAKRAKGTAILDREGQDWQPVSAEIAADKNMLPGQLIEKVDNEGPYKAQLEDITYTVKVTETEFTATASLALRRVADDE